jgi:succinylglutamate desuccinylase
MVDVYNIALGVTIKVSRIIGKIEGLNPGPTVVFFGGIHGNETSGVFALNEALKKINASEVSGTIYGISGNLRALKKHQRFIEEDLNRLWTKEHIDLIKSKTILNADESELLAILEILNQILETHSPPFYFIDLHTTSSKTLPFITINDALINRKFSKQFPVPIVLGIEEYLYGPLLSYVNQLGYVSLGFESGQHDDLSAITNSVAFIYLALVYSGVLDKNKVVHFPKYYSQLKEHACHTFNVFEIIYLHQIQKQEDFKMHQGFRSFEYIKKGTKLALSNNKELKAQFSGCIFMPLYQNKGNEGFFIIKPIRPFFLKLSASLRGVKLDSFLALLPGVLWIDKNKGVLQVDLTVAKYFAKSIFHLLGYRNKQITESYMRLNNRERVAKTTIYKREPWY